MSKIEFTQENLEKCICSSCPTQTASICLKGRKLKAIEMRMMHNVKKVEETGMLPKPETFPGMYCATGITTCDDFDFNQMCQCNLCAVWDENKLDEGEPMGYFCRDGKAE